MHRTVTSLAAAFLLSFAPPTASATLLTNGSFEDTSDLPTGGLPTTANQWSGDNSTYATAQNGIVPLDGNRMLSFIDTGNVPGSGTAAEVGQLIDATGLSPGVLLQASMYVNRVPGDAQTDTRFLLEIRAYPGAPATYPSDLTINELGITAAEILSDADAGTWELLQTAPWPLPAGTGYLAVRSFALENVFNDTVAPEFDGHYADLAALEIVPEPAGVGVWFLTVVGLGVVESRRRR